MYGTISEVRHSAEKIFGKVESEMGQLESNKASKADLTQMEDTLTKRLEVEYINVNCAKLYIRI